MHQVTYVSAPSGQTYLDKDGFAPVTTLSGDSRTNSFKVPSGTTFLKVIQRSDNVWKYKDSGGIHSTEPNSNSQWNVTYTRYRFSIPVIR